MKPKLVLPFAAVLVAAWLGMWVTDSGLLVYSADTRAPLIRECHYLIGVTVLKRIEPLAKRCEVLRTVGR
jgi:hypothetical protein